MILYLTRPSLTMTFFSDPSIPELVLFDAGEAVLLNAEELILLDGGDVNCA